MKRGEKIINIVLDFLTDNPDFENKKEVLKIIQPFVSTSGPRPESLDLMSISKLESLLGVELIYFPTKQQWRKIKLENINNNLNNDE